MPSPIEELQDRLNRLKQLHEEAQNFREHYSRVERDLLAKMQAAQPNYDEQLAQIVMTDACHAMKVSFDSAWVRRSREHRVVPARRIAWIALRQLGYSFPMIASLTRNGQAAFDHTSVIHALKRATQEELTVAQRIVERVSNDRQPQSAT